MLKAQFYKHYTSINDYLSAPLGGVELKSMQSCLERYLLIEQRIIAIIALLFVAAIACLSVAYTSVEFDSAGRAIEPPLLSLCKMSYYGFFVIMGVLFSLITYHFFRRSPAIIKIGDVVFDKRSLRTRAFEYVDYDINQFGESGKIRELVIAANNDGRSLMGFEIEIAHRLPTAAKV